MKNYKRAKFAYNLALYSLTSIITFLFFSSPFWFPSSLSSFPTIISSCFNAKRLFVLGNLIVIILVGDSKLKQPPPPPSSTSDIYDEYVARSRSSHHNEVKTLNVEEEVTNHHEENKKEIKFNSMSRGDEKREGMRSESVRLRIEGGKGKKEEKFDNEEGKIGMRSSRSAVWGESEKGEEEKMKMGMMRSCRSEIWSGSETVGLGKSHVAREEEEQQLHVLNKRVEDFIARVNKQRLLEAKIVHHTKV